MKKKKKITNSQLRYEDFLERNKLMTKEEQEKKNEEEKQKEMNKLKLDPSNKLFEELKFQQYYKYVNQNLFKGDYYIPKDPKELIYYLNLNFDNEKNDTDNIIEINPKNMCYCGEKAKNAMWVMGIAVHVGDDTRQFKKINKEFNSFSTYYKRRKSVLEDEINYYFYILLTILVVLSIIAGITNMVYIENISGNLYSDTDKNRHPKSPIKNFYHSFLDYICLMHSIVPYSVFFTLEIVLLIQKLYINWDIDLLNKNSIIIKDSKLIKDLGKVDLIFADKTGTLTRNERYFKYCIIADGCYEYRNDGKPSSLNFLNKDYKKALAFTDYDMINS